MKTLAEAISENIKPLDYMYPTTQTIYEAAAARLAEEQHKPGNTVKMVNFKVCYFYENGEQVPNYEYFLKNEMEV